MSPQNQIQTLREQIDDINLQILQLLNQRAQVASDIGKVQSEIGTSFYDPEREAQMLTVLQQENNGPFSNETISHLFKEIFKASLNLEETEAKAKLLVHRKSPNEKTVITLPDGTQIGNGNFQIVAGCCAVESYEQIDTVAQALVARGIKMMRGMAYKPAPLPMISKVWAKKV